MGGTLLGSSYSATPSSSLGSTLAGGGSVQPSAAVAASLGKAPGMVGGSFGASPGVSAALQKPPGMSGSLLASSPSPTPSSSIGSSLAGGSLVQPSPAVSASLGKAPGTSGGLLGSSQGYPALGTSISSPPAGGGLLKPATPTPSGPSFIYNQRAVEYY